MRVFVPIDYYVPGSAAGGALRTLANIIDLCGGDIDFVVATRNHDMAARQPYPGLRDPHRPSPRQVGRATVYYLPSRVLSSITVLKLAHKVEPDMVYFQSMFSSKFTILPLAIIGLFWRLTPRIVIAPRGELMEGALRQSTIKKRIYLWLFQALKLKQRVSWQASNESEAKEMDSVLGGGIRIYTIQDPVAPPPKELSSRPPKAAGTAQIVFASRIDEKKRLIDAVEAAAALSSIELSIYGAPSSDKYLADVLAQISAAEAATRIRYMGVIDHTEVSNVLAFSDALILPSKGENFGHIIWESLSQGCPVISTPQPAWPDFGSSGLGFTVTLGDVASIRQSLTDLTEMSEAQHESMRRRCHSYALSRYQDESNGRSDWLDLFSEVALNGIGHRS